jgi:hypothetical protein
VVVVGCVRGNPEQHRAALVTGQIVELHLEVEATQRGRVQHLDEIGRRMAVGLAAAYGDAQVFVGLQRNQLRQLGEMMLEMDRRLPSSDKFEIDL